MSDFNPKQGEMISVGSNNKTEREFVAMDGPSYICRGRDREGYFPWVAAQPLPTKPESIHFTRETWPKQPVWIRKSSWSADSASIVTGLEASGAVLGGDCRVIPFKELMKDGLMSLDFGGTWKRCRDVPESEE